MGFILSYGSGRVPARLPLPAVYALTGVIYREMAGVVRAPLGRTARPLYTTVQRR